MLTAEKIKSLLHLQPHPIEEGYFVETYRSDIYIAGDMLPSGYEDGRTLSSAIYYLLTPDTFSALHRLRTDEIFHFYLGDPVEMLQLWPDGTGKLLAIGNDMLNGMHPQVIVPQGVWQGTRLIRGGRFTLLGITMSPGFEFSDYEPGQREPLVNSYPEFKDLITALTR